MCTIIVHTHTHNIYFVVAVLRKYMSLTPPFHVSPVLVDLVVDA